MVCILSFIAIVGKIQSTLLFNVTFAKSVRRGKLVRTVGMQKADPAKDRLDADAAGGGPNGGGGPGGPNSGGGAGGPGGSGGDGNGNGSSGGGLGSSMYAALVGGRRSSHLAPAGVQARISGDGLFNRRGG